MALFENDIPMPSGTRLGSRNPSRMFRDPQLYDAPIGRARLNVDLTPINFSARVTVTAVGIANFPRNPPTPISQVVFDSAIGGDQDGSGEDINLQNYPIGWKLPKFNPAHGVKLRIRFEGLSVPPIAKFSFWLRPG